MSKHEAREIVDLVLAELVDMNIISSDRYGRITEDQQDKLAEMVAEKSEE